MPTMKETIQNLLINEYKVRLLPEAPHDLTRYKEVVKMVTKTTLWLGYINTELAIEGSGGLGYVHEYERLYTS